MVGMNVELFELMERWRFQMNCNEREIVRNVSGCCSFFLKKSKCFVCVDELVFLR